MIPQQYQKYCKESLKQVKILKQNIATMSFKVAHSNDFQLKRSYNHLNFKIGQLDQNLNSKIGQMYNKLITNFNSSVQPLPQIQQQDKLSQQNKLKIEKQIQKNKQLIYKNNNNVKTKSNSKFPKICNKKEQLLQSFSISKTKLIPFKDQFKTFYNQSTLNLGKLKSFTNKQTKIQFVKRNQKQKNTISSSFFKISKTNQINIQKQKQPKKYQQILDSYSLHNLIIRNGQILTQTPQFQSYRRIAQKQWNLINVLIRRLESILKQTDIKIVIVNGKQLAFLAKNVSKPSDQDILQCIPNLHELIHKFKKFKFKSSASKNIAAMKIQSMFRCYYNRAHYLKIKFLIKKVVIIQKAFRFYIEYKKAKLQRRKRAQEQYQFSKILRNNFKQNWIKRERVEIHLVGFTGAQIIRLSTQKIQQKMNIQLNRIFNVADPLCQIIYVAPFILSSEIINYYYKILQIGGINDVKNRLHFIWGQNVNVFSSHLSPIQALLYSPKALSRIKKIIRNKFCYIVPCYPSQDDIKLSCALNIPIMSGDSQLHLYLSLKSGSKRLFNQLQIPTAPCSMDIYDLNQLFNSFAYLILNNKDIKTWFLKIDDEINGRGLAWIHIDKIKAIRQIKQEMNTTGQKKQLINKLIILLKIKLPQKIIFNYPNLFKNYKQFMRAMLIRGGIIQAAPNCLQGQIQNASIFFNIQPNGKLKIISTYDKITKDNKPFGCISPSQNIQISLLQGIVKKIAKYLYQNKMMFGYFSLDLITFPNQQNRQQRLAWTIGLDCFLNNYSASSFYVFFVTESHYNIEQNLIITQNSKTKDFSKQDQNSQRKSNSRKSKKKLQKSSQIIYVYCPFIIHEKLSTIHYKSFFHLCRLENVSFDLKRKIGIVFMMLDSLQSGTIGIFSICDNYEGALRYLNNAFQFLQKKLGKVQKMAIINDESRTDKIEFDIISNKIKSLFKLYDKDNIKKSISNFSFIS